MNSTSDPTNATVTAATRLILQLAARTQRLADRMHSLVCLQNQRPRGADGAVVKGNQQNELILYRLNSMIALGYWVSCTVNDVMTRDVVSLLPSQSFGEAVGLMANRPFPHVLVIHPNGRLAGIISDRDLLRVMGATMDWKTKRLSEVMTQDVFTVTPQTPLSVAAREILVRRINCLPVLYDENKQVCGIVTSTDLLKAFEKLQASVERKSR
jgi:CBS domain-containing protein